MLEKEGSNVYENMTKKETQMLNREKLKLADQHRGIKDMKRLPDALIVVDAQYEDTAIREARRLEIPVIAIVDSNTDPRKVQFPIPANDDSMRTIQIIISALSDSILQEKLKGSSDLEQRSDSITKTSHKEKNDNQSKMADITTQNENLAEEDSKKIHTRKKDEWPTIKKLSL